MSLIVPGAPPQSIPRVPLLLLDDGCSMSPRGSMTRAGGPNIPGGTSIPAELPLQLHEVRWFHMKSSKYWQPFCGTDSLKLEVMHQMMQVLDKDTPACVDVMEDLYEADLKTRTCTAIYWTDKETTFKILRGTWFEVQGDKWYPLEEAESLAIEKKHCDPGWRIKDVKMDTTPADNGPEGSTAKPLQEIVIGRLALEKCDVIWMDDGIIYKQRKDLSSFLVLKIGEALGKGTSFSGICLRRGYKESAMEDEDDGPAPVGHLILMVHGIGENLDRTPISKSTTDFREACTQVAKRYFPEQWNEKRIEFIPVDWRTSLTLDDGILKRITLHGVKTLRDMLNDSVLDIFYYTSPKYRQEILSGLHTAINSKYQLFIKHHPHFLRDGGTVSIFAHSLGSVITYDLLHESCAANNIIHDNPVSRPVSQLSPVEVKGCGEPTCVDGGGDELRATRLKRLHDLRREVAELERLLGVSSSPDHLYSLDFKVEHFFVVGSPLGMFILMREHESLVKRGHRSSASLVPAEVCRRIHNLHHPSDPVAYRLEPLVNEAYANIRPVKMDSAGSKPSKTALDHAEGPKSDQTLAAPSDQEGGWWMSSLISIFPSSKILVPDPDKVYDTDSHIPHNERLKERIDFSLKEGLVDISYVNTLTAHTGYWASADCALYVLLQIYKCRRTRNSM